MSKVPNIVFNNGLLFPVLGLGTWQGPPGKEHEVGTAVRHAIEIGYRHFDCAHFYKNEKVIGKILDESFAEGKVKREDLFITSKLWNTFHRPEVVEPMLRTTLRDLGLDYLDLYLMHWPMGLKEGDDLMPIDPTTSLMAGDEVDYIDTWKAMEALVKKGLTKSIGVSNFNSQQLERLLKNTTIVPVTNQVECHPYLNQKKLRDYCQSKGISITAFSPLGSRDRPWAKPGDPDVLSDAKIKAISEKYGKTSAQLLLRYQVQLGTSAIPKSSDRRRLEENFNIFDFQLSEEDMAFIDTFDCNGRICPFYEARNHKYYPFSKDVPY